jgi:PAS domain S-box-containing protein
MKTANQKKTIAATDDAPGPRPEEHWAEALRISELRYRRLFETAQDGILILDADSGEIMDVNPFLIDLLDYPFDELRGRKLWEIGQFKDVAANRAAFKNLQENEYIRYENLPLRRWDGKRIQVEFVSNVYWVEDHKVIQCNIRDITTHAEERSDSQKQVAALELANGLKDAWLIAQSQRLRTPLSAIVSMLGLMEISHKLSIVRPLHDTPSEFDEIAFKHVRRNFQSLVGLFNELSELTGEAPLKIERDERSSARNAGTASPRVQQPKT